MPSMILVDDKTNEPLVKGQKVTTFREDEGTLTDWTPPRHSGSTGRIYVEFEGQPYASEFFPCVVGAKFILGDMGEGEA